MQGQEAKEKFKGCYVATLTPFDKTDRVDEGVVRAHTEWLVEEGVAGVCPVGTTGEFLFLSTAEKSKVFKATVDGAKGRVPVIAGVWGSRHEQVLALVKLAEDAGASGVFLPTPIYYPANSTAILRWYENARNGCSLPVFAYNIPQYAANEISLECLAQLFAEGTIAGAKDSSGKAERIGEQVRRFGEQGTIFAASDSFATEGRKLGADGFISAIANVAPSLFVKLWAGEESLQPQVDALRNALKQVGAISGLKRLLEQKGFAFGHSRIPYTEVPEGWSCTVE